MRAAELFQRVLLVAAPVAWLSGCDILTDSQPSTAFPGDDWEAATDLTSAYGGYEFIDEQPSFGDPAFAKIDAEEATAPVEVVDAEMMRGAFALRILWGALRGSPEMEQVTDWSGRIVVRQGGVGVLHTIAFEMPGDHLLPRESRQELGFVSHTKPHFDGLLLAIHDASDGSATLTFETEPLTRTWTLSELREIDTVIPVGDLGNAVSLQAIPLDPACPNGFVRGHWVHRDGERGVFRGVWATALGLPIGHIRGHFGMTPEGERVWFGKIINRAGLVIGLARGQWAPSADPEMPGGSFAGHWAARDGERRGDVAGHYLPTRDGERGTAGFFAGRWRTECDDGSDPAVP